MANKKTGKTAAHYASKLLKNKGTPKHTKTVAASDLSQREKPKGKKKK